MGQHTQPPTLLGRFLVILFLSLCVFFVVATVYLFLGEYIFHDLILPVVHLIERIGG